LPPQWATTEAARRGGQKDYSNDNLLKETSNGPNANGQRSFTFTRNTIVHKLKNKLKGEIFFFEKLMPAEKKHMKKGKRK
jgi:hypothetical protein